jgi:uncharacterized pyridoxal phosphate-dependent enzyme
MPWDDVMGELGLTPLINISGTETVFGASPVSPEVVRAIAGILPQSVEIAELQRAASRAIAAATGAEAGCVTNCTSASIVIAVAACMTGLDLAAIERLPDTTGLRNEVAIAKGHIVNYGSLISGDIRLTGARVVEFGAALETGLYQLRAVLGPSTAAAVYVVSHHAAPTGMIPLPAFVAACHGAGVPVIVDAAAEYGWRETIAAGADLVLFSAQKPLGGPTAGIIAGRRSLVRACYAQQRGIGRPMKAGKEAVVGTIAALSRWAGLDHDGQRRALDGRIQRLGKRLAGIAGLAAAAVPDETGNPFSRLVLTIDAAAAGFSAHGLAAALAAGRPRILVRALQADRGILQLDLRRLDEPTLALVGDRLLAAIAIVRQAGVGAAPAAGDESAAGVLGWLADQT